jgi:AcrR family transcriptional regulator
MLDVEIATPALPVPRGQKRRQEIADVAKRVFFESGYAETTMQSIALRAGASKETLYRHFGSKEGLFAEIVEARAKSFLADVDENFERPGSVAEVLRGLGVRLLDSMVGDEAVSLCRTVIAEATRNPDLGAIFFARGPERVRTRLTEFITAARDRGELTCDDPALAARLFLGAVVANYHLSRLVSPTPFTLSRVEIARHVEAAVHMFLATYGADKRPLVA